jgi:hypothetical protein
LIVALAAAAASAPNVAASPPGAAADTKPEQKPEKKTEAPRTFGADSVIADNDKTAWTGKALQRMKDGLHRLLVVLEEARDGKDVVKLNCVNEKLTQVKGLLRIAEQADILMQEALAKRDKEVTAHEFQKEQIAAQKIDQLKADAESCIGEQAVYSGDTVVTVEYSGKDNSDPTENNILTQQPAPLLRPPQVSPYQ